MSRSFTRSMLRSLMRMKDTRRIAREWERTEADPATQIARYAEALKKDFNERFELKDHKDHSWEVCVLSDFMVLGAERVDWTHVAKTILNRYANGRRTPAKKNRRWKWKR